MTCRVLKLARQPYYRWLANPITDSELVEAYRANARLYRSHGFTVLENGQSLPPFFGRPWVSPAVGPPAFFFYKKLAVDGGDL